MLIKTALRPTEVEARIRQLVRPRLRVADWLTFWFTWDGSRPPEFVGRVSEGEFKLRRLFGFWRYDFFPVLIGRIVPSAQGTEVRITMRPRSVDLIGPTAMIGFATVLSWQAATVVPVIIVAAMILPFAVVGWVAGARKARKILHDVLRDAVFE